MQQRSPLTVPAILRSLIVPAPTWAVRAIHGGAAGLLVVALAVCAVLDPAPQGWGTHAKLGLPSCLVCRICSIERCPSCGLTTALCHFMHGDVESARACHGAVVPVFFVMICLALFGTVVAISGHNWIHYEVLGGTVLGLIVLGVWVVSLRSLIIDCRLRPVPQTPAALVNPMSSHGRELESSQ